MNEKELLGVTRTAIEAAFVDTKTRQALLARLGGKGSRSGAATGRA